jgi:heme-degrading monooxygenase HmoA
MAAGIARVWKGYGSAEGVRQYCDEYFSPTLLPELRRLNGFIRATVLLRERAEDSEVVVATVWESIEAVKGFAGEDYEQAVVEPVVLEMLQRFEDRVSHYTIGMAS